MTSTHPAPRSDHASHGLVYVFFAGLLYGSAGLFARALPYDAWTMLGWRSLAGGLFMAGLHVAQRRRVAWREWRMAPEYWALVPIYAASTISYIVALKITTVAEVMIVYATAPFVTAGVAWAWIGERPSRRVLAASVVALAGIALMLGGAPATPGRWWGALLIVIMNVGFAMTLVLARRRPTVSMLPVNAYSLLLAAGVGFALAPGQPVPAAGLAGMIAFGVLTVGLAMTFFMIGAREAPSAEVSLVGLTDVVLAPLMVWLVFGENPGLAAVAGGLVVTGAVAWNVWPALRRGGNPSGGRLTSAARSTVNQTDSGAVR